MKYISASNALALLPLESEQLQDLDAALAKFDNGQRGAAKGSVRKLIERNKRWKGRPGESRLCPGELVDQVYEYTVFRFDNDPPEMMGQWSSHEAYEHGTKQSPMLRISMDRVPGSSTNLQIGDVPSGRVVSRRIISVPIQFVLKGWGNALSGYMIYDHAFMPLDYEPDHGEQHCYTGLTSRGWMTRYSEHKRHSLTGSNLLFHTSLSKAFDDESVIESGMGLDEPVRAGLVFYSELHYTNLTYERAMEIEEKLVERTLSPKGLNMIPGGFAGMKMLHTLGYLNQERASLDDRDRAAITYIHDHPRLGKPAPWVSEMWNSDEHYQNVILKRTNTLDREQVLSIRQYGNEWNCSPEIISGLTGASVRQVKDVLSGKYYSRVK